MPLHLNAEVGQDFAAAAMKPCGAFRIRETSAELQAQIPIFGERVCGPPGYVGKTDCTT